MKKNSKSQEYNMELSATPILGEPQTVFDMVNKYGTYEIQPTADTDNEFPTIAQGKSDFEKTSKKSHSK